MSNISYVQAPTLYLAGSGVVVGATSVTLTSFKDIYDNVLTMADFGPTGYITFEPDSDNEESATFTGVTANTNGTYTLTGLKSSLAKSPYTETSGLVRSHGGGTALVITDTAAFWNKFPSKSNQETIDGQWTFTNTPIVPGTVSDASTTVKGVAKLSTAPVSASDPIAYGANEPAIAYIPTSAQKNALAGSQGVPDTGNPYVTKDNVYDSDTDQTQTTQNSSQAVGEADTTGKANLLAQSFIPTKTKIRGVTLYKSADTGTFTGTVKVALQANSSGSPSGSDLASVTISNATWLTTPTSTFNAIFSSEYSAMVVGSLYWIVITPSTSDNSNHPNLGTNTAGGYSSGSVKYKNTTDGWTAISTVDLYFKTLQGVSSQLTYASTSGSVITKYTSASSTIGDAATQFNITNPSGTTFRYTYNSTGGDPSLSLANNPIGSLINFQADNFNGNNNGLFVVVGAGSNYVEVINASGVVESNKAIGTTGYVQKGTSAWTKPPGLRCIQIEVQAGGGGGGGASADGSGGFYTVGQGGGGGGYSKKIVQASSLNSSEYYLVGHGGAGGSGGAVGVKGGYSAFGTHCYATSGSGGGHSCTNTLVGNGGLGVNGDVNFYGKTGSVGMGCYTNAGITSKGGDSILGAGAPEYNNGSATSTTGASGSVYGGGGGGALSVYSGGAQNGGAGAAGIVIITEYYY